MAAPQHLPPSLALALKEMGDQVVRLQRRIYQLERNQRMAQLGNSTIQGGTLTVADSTGTPVMLVGQQGDGTFSVTHVNAAQGPPPQPSDPTVMAGINMLLVTWDGTMADTTDPLADFAKVNIYCADSTTGEPPGTSILQGSMTGPGTFMVGNLVGGDDYFVWLTTSNEAGLESDPSNQVPGSPLTVGGSIGPNEIVAGMVNFSATDIGGLSVTLSPFPPVNPAVGTLWYDANNGYLLNQWDGNEWVPYQFGTNAISAGSVTAALIAAGTITATQIAAGTIIGGNIAAGTITASNIAAGTITATEIAAGTIVAANIAAGTITSAQILAGTVLAGAVDGTTITGAQLIADGTSGVLLAYGGAPTTGNLVAAISPVAGTDSHSNAYTAGLTIQQGQLVLATSSTPAASAIGPVVFGQSNGHLQVVDGGDGSLYDTQHRTLVCNGNTNVASTTPVLVPSLQLGVAAGLYMIDGFLIANIVVSCAPFIKINCPAVSNMLVGVITTYSSGTGEDVFNSNITTAGGTSTSPTVLLPTGVVTYIRFSGSMVFTGSGTLSISIVCGTSAGNWTVLQGSYLNVFPV